MCFSASASFMAAAVTGAAGIVALMRAEKPNERLLAAVPLLFGVQQAVEGMIWLKLTAVPDGSTAFGLTMLFLFFAKVFWPIVAPLTALLVEPSPGRRRMMAVCLAIGVAVGVYFLWSIVTYVPTASVGHGHIVYEGEPESPLALKIGYFAAVSMGAALSSFRTLRLFALIVFAGSLISYLFYWEAFSSVWCFFAAAASAVIVLHFEQVRQLRRASAGH